MSLRKEIVEKIKQGKMPFTEAVNNSQKDHRAIYKMLQREGLHKQVHIAQIPATTILSFSKRK